MKPGVESKVKVEIAENIFSRGGLLVVRSGGAFPPRCVFCNSDCDGEPRIVTLTANPPIRAGFIGGLLGGVIGGLIGGTIDYAAGVRVHIFKFNVHICLAHRHVKKLIIRNVLIIIGISIVAGIIGWKLSQGYREAAAFCSLLAQNAYVRWAN